MASNRYGLERSLQDPQGLSIRFYGSSFIADATGAKIAEAAEEGDAVLDAAFDLSQAAATARQLVCVFRDRRPGFVWADCIVGWRLAFRDPLLRFFELIDEACVLAASLRVIRYA